MIVDTYDILDAGPRNRFTVRGRVVHNSAGGVQLQNITAKGPKTLKCNSCGGIFGRDIAHIGCPRCGNFVDVEEQPEWTIEAVEQAIADVLRKDLDHIENTWGDPIALLCGCLRGLFIAKEDHKLICVDFSAIEAVAAACLARCQWRIEIFSGHGKIYEQSAANATGIPFEEILAYKKANGMHHSARKTIGKVRELAGGYGGWIGAWKNFGADAFMTDDEIKADVLKWREESPEIVEMWGGQFRWCGPGKWDYMPELFGLEGAAINAILNPGKCFSHTDITYGVRDDILYCRLPSGRYLHYHKPRLVDAVDKLNRGPCFGITFEGHNSNAAKGPVGWHRMETYGGRLFENCIAENTPVLTSSGWKPIQDVTRHDAVHDGVDWVKHGGLVFKSNRPCITVDGVPMTDDHEVYTVGGWRRAAQNPAPYRPKLQGGCVSERVSAQADAGVLPVYDIVNAGPRHRFVVKGDNGPFIVHNCVQAVAADIQFEGLKRCEANGYPIVMHTHDEGTAEVPIGFGSVEEMAAIMSERPAWAAWWPLRAAGWEHKRYQKD